MFQMCRIRMAGEPRHQVEEDLNVTGRELWGGKLSFLGCP